MNSAFSYTQWIDGEKCEGRGDGSSAVFNPATEELLGEVKHASADDVQRAIAAAARAFPSWRQVPAFQRARMLHATAHNLRQRQHAIARSITLELGKPLRESLREVETAADMFEWAAEEGRRSYGRTIPPRSPLTVQLAELEPIGPVAAFAGWNAPAITPARKISGALAAGCTIVLKPSEETPGPALAIAQAAADAGIPPGVVNLVFGPAAPTADQLLAAPEIRMITFTGSVPVGKALAEKAARGMKRATLELGGHAPVIVMDDVDVVTVARSSVGAKFRNSGQICVSPTRFYVQESIYERFVHEMVNGANELRVGNGLDESTQMGPLKNERRRLAIERLVEDARGRGARVAAGGKRIVGPGFFYRPTVLTDLPDGCLATYEEPFGPLAMVNPFKTLQEVTAAANSLPLGLAAYVFTRDLLHARKLAEDIESGVVCINDFAASLPETPFGGVKDSGLGLEGGIEGLREFQRVKSIRQGTIV